LLRHEAQGHNPFGLGDRTWRVTGGVHLDTVVSTERRGSETLEVATVHSGNKEVGSFKAPYGDTSAPNVTLTADGLVAYAEIGADEPVREMPPTDVRPEDESGWKPMAAAARLANQLVKVNWDGRRWKRMFNQHSVGIRPHTKNDGTKATRRVDVNISNVLVALKAASKAGDFQKIKSERDRRHAETCRRIDAWRDSAAVAPEFPEND